MPLSRRPWIVLSVAPLLGVLTACKQVKDFGGAFTDLLKLKEQLSKKLGHSGIELMIVNGNLLRIEVVNSSLSSLPDRERKLKSFEIAKFAYAALASWSQLSTVLVIFATKRSHLFLLHTQVVDSSALFPVNALAQNSQG